MKEAWIVDAVRTPIGRHGGALAQVRPDDLGAVVLKALLQRTGVPASDVEDVYMGCANQAGEDNRNVARTSLLLAGFPEDVPGCTVNRLCGSGLEAVAEGARAVMLGEAGTILRILADVSIPLVYLLLLPCGPRSEYRAYIGLASPDVLDLPIRFASRGIMIERGEEMGDSCR